MKAKKILEMFLKGYAPEDEDIAEAIVEIDKLNSRSCDNCKQFAKYENQDFGDCFGMARTLSDIDTVSKNFCCNKWESE